MTITLGRPAVDELSSAVGALREWQSDGAPWQLHPGDVGWFWRFGAQATAEAVRTWSRDGQILAVGLLDGADLLRVTMAPEATMEWSPIVTPGMISAWRPTQTLAPISTGPAFTSSPSPRGWKLVS